MIKFARLKSFLSSSRFFYILLFTITSAAGVLFVIHTKQAQDEEMRNNLITYARTIEKSIDWQPFSKTLNTDPDLIKVEDLVELNSKLNSACRVNVDC
ncbi:MAG: hypothetical protein V4440_12805, partial [Pseudomonadota bacterium]